MSRVLLGACARTDAVHSSRTTATTIRFMSAPLVSIIRSSLIARIFMAQEAPDTHFKALQVNLDPVRYGTFAEIGAGQEVARWFFRVGGAAGTVAKAMSAYDMTFSDAIYGVSERYVSKQRINAMLDHEFRLLKE